MPLPFKLLLIVGALVTSAVPRTVLAGKDRAVHIESDPPGAQVFLDDRAGGARGRTPLDVELGPGTYTVILELEGHQPASQALVVELGRGKKSTTPVNLKVVLTPSLATLEVAGAIPQGAHVLVDERDRGDLPLALELEAGAHLVQVMLDGQVVFEQHAELARGAIERVTVRGPASDMPTAAAPTGPPPTWLSVRAGFRSIWRRFTYDGAVDTHTTGTFESDGKLMARIEAEIAPWRRSPSARRLWPLTMVMAAGITATDTATRFEETANFNQRELEAGVRYRIPLGARAALGLDVGWGALLYNFNGDLAYALPDVDYQLMRLGLRGEGAMGPLVGWVGIENRLVAGAGDLGDRFKSASADGFAARVGVLARLWDDRVELGAEYSLVRFGWSFEPKDGAPEYVADGATDTFQNLGGWVGVSY